MPEERKLVTVLFADIVGSTSMTVSADAEVVRARLAGLFARTRQILVDHGGTVEKFIGDEVMAVFGIPAVHEDDPERAVRSAVALRAAFAQATAGPIGALELRIGINTGEVVAGSGDTPQFLVTGQAVNFAARLEKACIPGEILVGPLTQRLTAGVARYGSARTIEAKGLGTIDGRPLLSLGGSPTRATTPFVGRDRELVLLGALWEQTAVSGRPCLVTVLGEAGIGKTRIVDELLDRMRPAHTVRVRCAPYGEGIGLRPIEHLLDPGDPEGLDATARFRRHIASLAADGTVAVIVEDIHWADPALLDAIETLVDRVRGPVVIFCLARDDLLRSRRGWAGGRASAASVTLGPLSDEAILELVLRLAGETLPDGSARFIAAHAEGNPLFVREYVRTLGEPGALVAAIPPTLRSLLAARLDHLPAEEREFLRRASVVGRVFGRDALRVLGLDGPTVDALLDDAVARETLVPSPSEAGAWSFAHALFRDVAYASLPKSERVGYHERLSAWSEEEERDVGFAAHHAERALENAGELGSDRVPALAARAFVLLQRAGERSADTHDALARFEHALRLAPLAGPDTETLFRVRASAVMARLRLQGSADAVAEMDELLTESESRAPSENLVHLLVWKASVRVLEDPADADAILRRAAEVAARIEGAGLVPYVRWASSEPAAAAGDRARERTILGETLAAIPPGKTPALRVYCIADTVANALATGDVATATAVARELEPFIDAETTPAARLRALVASSAALLASGEVPSASRRADAAAAIARDLASPWALARAALARAACDSAAGMPERAVSILGDALATEDLARRPTMRGVVAELRCALALAHAAVGDRDAAEREIAETRRTAPLADARVRANLERAWEAVAALAPR